MKAVNSSNRSGFDSLLKLYRETDVAEEKGRLLGNLFRLRHCFTASIGANFSQSHLLFFQEHNVTKLSFWTTITFISRLSYEIPSFLSMLEIIFICFLQHQWHLLQIQKLFLKL